jgi:hypothetical protein
MTYCLETSGNLRKPPETPGNLWKPLETSGNLRQPPATSGNLRKPPETSGNLRKPPETSKNLRKSARNLRSRFILLKTYRKPAGTLPEVPGQSDIDRPDGMCKQKAANKRIYVSFTHTLLQIGLLSSKFSINLILKSREGLALI